VLAIGLSVAYVERKSSNRLEDRTYNTNFYRATLASVIISSQRVSVRLSVRHTPVLYQNGQT